MILMSSGSFGFVPVCLCMATSIGPQKILLVSLVIIKTGFCFVLKCYFQCMAQLSLPETDNYTWTVRFLKICLLSLHGFTK